MTLATFQNLVAQTYIFDVVTPGGDTLSFEVRAPTQAELWAMERDLPPRPQPPIEFEGTFAEGDWKPTRNRDDPAYLRALNEWLRNLQMHRILLCWTAEVDGDTQEEKLAALDRLPNWTISALNQCTLLVITAGEVSITDTPFRAD